MVTSERDGEHLSMDKDNDFTSPIGTGKPVSTRSRRDLTSWRITSRSSDLQQGITPRSSQPCWSCISRSISTLQPFWESLRWGSLWHSGIFSHARRGFLAGRLLIPRHQVQSFGSRILADALQGPILGRPLRIAQRSAAVGARSTGRGERQEPGRTVSRSRWHDRQQRFLHSGASPDPSSWGHSTPEHESTSETTLAIVRARATSDGCVQRREDTRECLASNKRTPTAWNIWPVWMNDHVRVRSRVVPAALIADEDTMAWRWLELGRESVDGEGLLRRASISTSSGLRGAAGE